jgi:hypothetical protein
MPRLRCPTSTCSLVDRVLRQLRERGLITVKAHQVIILDLDGLKELADYDCGYLNHGRPDK